MDNEDNLFDDKIDDDEDLLDISLNDLTTDDFEEPAAEEPDEEVIELIDLVEKSDDDIDEDIIDYGDTKPLPVNQELIEKLKLAAVDNGDDVESEEIGDTASISRSDLELGDITLETVVPDLTEDMEKEEISDPDISDADIDLDLSEKVADFDETADFLDDSLDKSRDEEDTVDLLADDSGSEDIITDEDNDLDESLEELFKDDEEVTGETAGAVDDVIDDRGEAADDLLVSGEIEEKSIDVSDKPVEADTGQLNETVIGPLSDKEELSEGSQGKEDIHDQPVDEKIQSFDVNQREEASSPEDGVKESIEDPGLPVEDDADAVLEEKSDDMIDASPDKREDAPYRAEPAVLSEEKIEEAVTKVVGEVVEKVAREVFTEVAEKIITEAIDGLKKSLEADSE